MTSMETEPAAGPRGRQVTFAAYAMLAISVLALAAGGYAAFVLYARSGVSAASGAGLLALAVAAGTASFFSPCSFALLVTLLTREAGSDTSSPAGRRTTGRALLFAGSIAVGAAAFLLPLGLGLAAGGGALFRRVTFTSGTGRAIRATAGAVLALLGLVQLNVFRLPGFDAVANVGSRVRRSQAQFRRRRPLAGFALFGFGYLLAGFG